MALLQGLKKLFGLLLDDLDCVSTVKEAMELQVEARIKHRHLQPRQGHADGKEDLSGR